MFFNKAIFTATFCILYLQVFVLVLQFLDVLLQLQVWWRRGLWGPVCVGGWQLRLHYRRLRAAFLLQAFVHVKLYELRLQASLPPEARAASYCALGRLASLGSRRLSLALRGLAGARLIGHHPSSVGPETRLVGGVGLLGGAAALLDALALLRASQSRAFGSSAVDSRRASGRMPVFAGDRRITAAALSTALWCAAGGFSRRAFGRRFGRRVFESGWRGRALLLLLHAAVFHRVHSVIWACNPFVTLEHKTGIFVAIANNIQ